MIWLIAFFLPLVVSLIIGAILGVHISKASAKSETAHQSLTIMFAKAIAVTGIAIFTIGVALAVMFADTADTTDGDANPAEFMQYMHIQWVALSLFPLVVLIMSALLARQKRSDYER